MIDQVTPKTSKVSSKGQVVIPVELRRKLGLQDGDQVTIDVNDNNELVLKKLPTALDWHNLITTIPNEKIDVDQSDHYNPKKAPHFHD
ncbi:AbrB/MazE/SpoVT family DNA-binding domain-containing protein [Tetragenococcus koreensis]|uniref:AbrB/MazE/SpoVT family DNA-binding domain-containing protein n=1 Tax=Tetragenococcus koreensis TaxID=290335 RepID=UPI001F17D0A5|nr:AbrB/MazE/SpoVT family DNA-binding domain-containing protein [Tetragenococcus koreensis]MCF1620004.1 AbrB/MazE/SpoVT family DNA-binding domain-containing protein [Tetragenococcus koreensis]MCF1657457.1 AbrB/MazE/SpoVT family DNA-binding domain-containing protein [Tetragenococcus koreensis]